MPDFTQFKELWVFLISMLPVVELRGAIPVGLASGINPYITFILSVAGNLLPIPFILLFIRPLFNYLKQLERLRTFIKRLEEKAFSKSDQIAKYNIIGLIIFVAIPLPGTGAWTGALIASLLNIRFKTAMFALTMGVLIAGGLVTGIYYLIVSGAFASMGFLQNLLKLFVDVKQ